MILSPTDLTLSISRISILYICGLCAVFHASIATGYEMFFTVTVLPNYRR